MSYHCPRCGFYYCQNFGGSLSEALTDWPRECRGEPPIPTTIKDDPDVYPF